MYAPGYKSFVQQYSSTYTILIRYIFIFSSRNLGDDWTIPDDIMAVIETFTCVIYGCNRETSVNAVRHILLKKMVDEENLTELSKIDLSKLPPCRDSLIQHVKQRKLQSGQL